METTSTFIRTESDMADHLDNGVAGLHWVAADGTILWANRADDEPLGYTREEWGGHHATEFHADYAALGDMSQRLSKGGDDLQLSGTLTSQERLTPERPDLFQRLV
jgi:hypothetical protein